MTPHGTFGETDGGVLGEQGGRGWVRERSQTRIVWRDLNPVWKQEFNWEILNPDEEVTRPLAPAPKPQTVGTFWMWDETCRYFFLHLRGVIPAPELEFWGRGPAPALMSCFVQRMDVPIWGEDGET